MPHDKSAAQRCGEPFPVALRIAAPADRIALAAGPAGAAPHDRRPGAFRLEFLGRLEHALVVQQRIDVVQPASPIAVVRDGVVGHLFAEVALDYVDAGGEQRAMRIAPPRVRFRIGEVDDAAFRQRRQHAAERAGAGRRVPAEYVGRAIGCLEQVAAHARVAGRGASESRRTDTPIRIRAGDARGSPPAWRADPESDRDPIRSRSAISTRHAARPSRVSTSHGIAPFAQQLRDDERLFRRLVVARATPTGRGSSAAPAARVR